MPSKKEINLLHSINAALQDRTQKRVKVVEVEEMSYGGFQIQFRFPSKYDGMYGESRRVMLHIGETLDIELISGTLTRRELDWIIETLEQIGREVSG